MDRIMENKRYFLRYLKNEWTFLYKVVGLLLIFLMKSVFDNV